MRIFLALYVYILLVQGELNCPPECKCDMVHNLRRASCVGKRLVSIEADIPEGVQFLELSNNTISILPNNGFTDLNMGSLVIVNISNNMISTIELRAFDGLEQLQIVDLSNNILHKMPQELFESHKNLKKIFLAGNKFTSLQPEPFLESDSVQLLDVSRCLIPHIYPENFSKLPSLSVLDISQNFLIHVEVQVVAHLPKLKTLKLDGNKWKCDPTMTGLYKYLRKKNIAFVDHCNLFKQMEKIVMQVTTEENIDIEVPHWKYDTCDCEIETLNRTDNEIAVETHSSELPLQILILVLAFIFGTVFGVYISYLYVSYGFIGKKERSVDSEILLNDMSNNYNMMTTPVMTRVRREMPRTV